MPKVLNQDTMGSRDWLTRSCPSREHMYRQSGRADAFDCPASGRACFGSRNPSWRAECHPRRWPHNRQCTVKPSGSWQGDQFPLLADCPVLLHMLDCSACCWRVGSRSIYSQEMLTECWANPEILTTSQHSSRGTLRFSTSCICFLWRRGGCEHEKRWSVLWFLFRTSAAVSFSSIWPICLHRWLSQEAQQWAKSSCRGQLKGSSL